MRKDFLWGGATAANQYEGGSSTMERKRKNHCIGIKKCDCQQCMRSFY